MSVASCLAKLQDRGEITPDAAAAAKRLWERYQGRFSLDMPPAQADAAAALQAARTLAQSTKEKRLSVAKQTIAQTSAERAQMAHPRGPSAGALAILTRDIWREGGANVDTRTQVLREWLFSKFNTGVEAYASKLAGLKQDVAGARNMVRELFGIETGDTIAQAAAKGFTDAAESATARVKEGGKIFEPMEDWRLPQPWNSDQVRRAGLQTFTARVNRAIDAGGLTIWDKERLMFATDRERIAVLVDKAARDIITEAGDAQPFSRQMRTFHFTDGQKGFDAWSDLQGSFGAGADIYNTLSSHLGSMAREIGLVEILGPQHEATVRVLERNAKVAERLAGEGKSAGALAAAALKKPWRFSGLESPAMIRRVYDVLSGRANGVENATIAATMNAARSVISAAQLGSAVVSAVPGDSVTMLLAARHNGMSVGRVLSQTVAQLAKSGGEHAQAQAARLLVTGHAMSDHAIGTVRYAEQLVGDNLAKRTADFVIRGSGLNAWTEAAKKAFTLEMLGHLGDHVGLALDGLPSELKAFMKRYGIDAGEWDALRARPLAEIGGAKFFDSSLATEDPAVRKLFEGVIEERAFAVLEPDARIRAIVTGGAKGGTILGEIARSMTMFTSFSQTMIATHLMGLAAKDGFAGNRMLNASLFVGLHIMAGAAIVQARQILTGKDPIDMSSPKFWAQATAQGGGAGFYGDLISKATEAQNRSLAGQLTGPVGGLLDETVQTGHAIATGKPNAAGKVIDLAHHLTPGSNLWFARLGMDRLVFDNLHRALDPTYAEGFARRENRLLKENNQQSFWRSGDSAPARAPNFGAAFGQQ